MDNKTRVTLANVFVAVALALVLTAIYAMLTDSPSLKWARSFIVPAFLLSLAAGRLRKKARGGN